MAMITVNTPARNSDTMRDREQDGRDRHQPVHDAHDDGVEPAEVAGEQADEQADGDADQRHRDADQERDARAVDHAAVDVAAEAVGAEHGDHLDALAGVGPHAMISAPGTLLRAIGLIAVGSMVPSQGASSPISRTISDDRAAEHDAGLRSSVPKRGRAWPARPQSAVEDVASTHQ